MYLATVIQSPVVTVLLLIASVALILPVILIGYRLQSLYRARYVLEREGLRLRWGLRMIDIPLTNIEWVRSAADFGNELKKPLLWLPGSVYGVRNSPGIGAVEFLSADSRKMILLGTRDRAYAISPADMQGFMRWFQVASELGSLTEFSGASVEPVSYAKQVWQNKVLRVLALTSVGGVLLLLVLSALKMTGKATLSLGYSAQGDPLPPIPAQQVLLLPVLAIFLLIFCLLLGLYYFRRENNRPITYLLWSASALTPLLLLLALLLIR